MRKEMCLFLVSIRNIITCFFFLSSFLSLSLSCSVYEHWTLAHNTRTYACTVKNLHIINCGLDEWFTRLKNDLWLVYNENDQINDRLCRWWERRVAAPELMRFVRKFLLGCSRSFKQYETIQCACPNVGVLLGFTQQRKWTNRRTKKKRVKNREKHLIVDIEFNDRFRTKK